jgi:hypothetical protein
MSVFLESLKRNGHLESLHMTICNVGSRKLSTIILNLCTLTKINKINVNSRLVITKTKKFPIFVQKVCTVKKQINLN